MRERLMAVAMACFDRHGIDKTVMDDIAKAAGVSRPTVYRYLGDRNTLLLTLVDQRARLVIAQTQRVIRKYPRFEDKIVEGMLHAVEKTREDPYLAVLVSPQHLELASRLVVANERSVQLNVELWQQVLEDAQRAGQLRPELDLHDVCEWLSQVEFIFAARTDRLPKSSQALRKVIRTFVLPGLIPDPVRATNVRDGNGGRSAPTGLNRRARR